MKIKTKKEMNLPELIEWIEKNRRFGETFDSNRYNYVDVNVDGVLSFTGNFCEDIFTVEIEEEITEDTVLNLIVRYIGRFGDIGYLHNKNTTIKNSLKDSSDDCLMTNFYFENQDRELVLIWTREKGLVG